MDKHQREKIYKYINLITTHKIGPNKIKELIKKYQYIKNIDISIDYKKDYQINYQLDLIEKLDITVRCLEDTKYPSLLKQIYDPPPILMLDGNTDILNYPQIAIVGGRKASKYGQEIAYHFAEKIAANGLFITSGLASGIDTYAHKGAINNTIAVMGTGLDIIYPKNNYSLAKKILTNNGCLISEFLLGTQPNPYNFPRRNRIISALSLAIILIEAREKSGSLITARFGLEHGKDIYVVPGDINNINNLGGHKLIKDGAILLDNINDLLENYKHISSKKAINLDDNSLLILKSLKKSITCFDEIIYHTKLDINLLNNLLVDLELAGFCRSVAGGYIKT